MNRSLKTRKRSKKSSQEASESDAQSTVEKSTSSPVHEVRPAKKRPSLLGILIVAFAAWLALLVYLAIRVNT